MATETSLQEIEVLRKNNMEMRATINHLESELETMNKKLTTITNEKEKLRRDTDTKIAELKEELREKNSELEASIHENAGLEAENKSLVSQINNLQKENGNLSSKLKSLEGEIGELKGETKRLNDELGELKGDNKRLNDELQSEYDHVTRLTTAIKEELEELEELELEKLMEKAEEGMSKEKIGVPKEKCHSSVQSIDLLQDLMGKYKLILVDCKKKLDEYNNLKLLCDKLQTDYDQLKHHVETTQGGVHNIEEEETNIQPLFGCLTPKIISIFDAVVALIAFGTEGYLVSLGEDAEEHHKLRYIFNIVGFLTATISAWVTLFSIFIEARFHGVGWDKRWFYKEEKPYVPLVAIGEIIITLGSVFLFGNTIPIWTPVQLKPGVHHFCFGISTLCFFYKFLKAVIARLLGKWWWTGGD